MIGCLAKLCGAVIPSAGVPVMRMGWKNAPTVTVTSTPRP